MKLIMDETLTCSSGSTASDASWYAFVLKNPLVIENIAIAQIKQKSFLGISPFKYQKNNGRNNNLKIEHAIKYLGAFLNGWKYIVKGLDSVSNPTFVKNKIVGSAPPHVPSLSIYA